MGKLLLAVAALHTGQSSNVLISWTGGHSLDWV